MEIRSLRENSTQSLELRQLNDRLAKTEQKLLLEEGLPGRPWYKHVVDAPGLYAGYGAQTFPSLIEALSHGLLTETRNFHALPI